MTRITYSLVVFLCCLFVQSRAQDLTPTLGAVGQKNEALGSYPITGCRVLRNEEAKLQAYIKAHPEVLEARSLQKTTAWNFKVGDTKSWWATDLTTQSSEYLVPSTCRAVGVNAYIFVEDALWTNGRVNQAGVDSIQIAFDSRTPASSSKGIYQIDVETFGDPPNVDGDAKIIILILDIKDGYAGSGGYVAGYFFYLNQLPEGTFAGRHSNVAEIYYVDGDPGDFTKASGVTTAASTTAHEFQHMIHWRWDNQEITFVNESCSEGASLVCGYSYTGQSLYTDDTDVDLLVWNSGLDDYSRAARWSLYLWNQFPNGFLKSLVANIGTGYTGINNALASYSPVTSRRFNDVFKEWLVANYLNDISVDSRYGYTYTNTLTKPKATVYLNPNAQASNKSVSRLGAHYMTFSGGSNLSITFTSSSATLSVKAIKTGASAKSVVDVPLNTAFNEPAFGTTYTSITFVVANTSQAQSATYSFQASGTGTSQTVETKYDNGTGYRVLPLSANDTVAVYFDGVQGAILDSIRVAFQTAGGMTFGLWQYTGAMRPSPLGAAMVPIFQMNVTSADTNITPTTESSTKWVTKSFFGLNISASPSFVVAGIVGSTPTAPGVMVAKTAHTGSPDHSYTYLNKPSNNVPNWYYLTADNSANVWLYMIRAYAHVPGTVGVEEVIELTPKTFTLQQNYPNPFNPSTSLEFQLATSGFVSIRVFDMLGREVAVLINEERSPGTYNVVWDASTFPSGIYFCRMYAGGFVETRKMTLIR